MLTAEVNMAAHCVLTITKQQTNAQPPILLRGRIYWGYL